MHMHESSFQRECQFVSNICSRESFEKPVEYAKTEDDCDGMGWTTKYIPETCLHEGKTFRQQVRKRSTNWVEFVLFTFLAYLRVCINCHLQEFGSQLVFTIFDSSIQNK